MALTISHQSALFTAGVFCVNTCFTLQTPDFTGYATTGNSIFIDPTDDRPSKQFLHEEWDSEGELVDTMHAIYEGFF